MPPERGTVKKSPYDKKPTVSTTSKKTKDDAKDSRLKYESSREKDTNKTRDLSTSRTSKDKVQKDEVKTRTSVREKLAALKNETEKTRMSSKDRKDDRTKPKVSQQSSRVKPEITSRSTKPTTVSGRNPTTPRRTQLSYHNTTTTDKPKATPSRGDARKRVDASVKRTENTQKPPAKKEVIQRSKLPDKMVHPQSMGQSRTRGRQTQKVIDEPKRLGRDRTRTRTLSPTEVKMARGEPQNRPPTSSKEERKEIVSVAGPSTSQQYDQSGGDVLQQDNDDYDGYEDDFEDYESDFEEDSGSETSDEGADIKNDGFSSDIESDSESESELRELTPRQHPLVEEEKKLDSGNYDLAERRRKGRELQEIKMAMEKENETLYKQSRVVESQLVPADEGYEEGKTEDNKKFSSTVTNLSFINFANARKRKQEKKATEGAKKRGEVLLDMIQLDTVSFTLFDLPPIPYDVYMKSYGRSNTLQAHAQTNEDNLTEEIQTDEIVYKNKWTQNPVSFQTKSGKKDIMFSQDNLGVGGDSVEDDADSWKQRIKVNTVRLNQFISSAGQVMLMLLEEGQTSGSSMLNRNTMEISFSDGFISLGVESVPFLSGTSVTSLQFAHRHSMILLSVHKNHECEKGQNDGTSIYKSIIAVWNILEPSFPQKVLVAPNEVTVSCFEPTTANLVIAGLRDGSVCVWDLREKSHSHRKVETQGGDWTIRSPTYNTAEILKDKGHTVQVVAVQPLLNSEEESEYADRTELSPSQICSLDEGGTVIVWTVIQSHSRGGMATQDLGLAHWGRVRLVRSSSFSLAELASLDQNLLGDVLCYDMQLDGHDHSHLYIATSMGYVVHSLKTGGKAQPQFYIPNRDEFTVAKCIETFPYKKPYFLVGCDEGTIRLHSQSLEKPLATLAGTADTIGEGPPILSLQWSRSKPFIFYVLDNASRIHVWDLSKSDIYPQYTIPFGTITAMQLSPDTGDAKNPPYMALATGPGRVEVHQLRTEYYNQSSSEMSKELHKFIHYTSIL